MSASEAARCASLLGQADPEQQISEAGVGALRKVEIEGVDICVIAKQNGDEGTIR